jgi:hypothetical protein
MKKLTLPFVLMAITVGSALAQPGNPPGQTPYPATLDNPIWLRAEKIWGAMPGHAASVELLASAPVLSTTTGSVQVSPSCNCANATPLVTNSAIRLAAVLPGWNLAYPQVYATISMSSCSNEPNHAIKFNLRAGAVSSGGDTSNPSFGDPQSVTNSVSGAYVLSQNAFAPLTVGNATGNNNLVIFELSRGTDSFTNAVAVGSITVSYAKSVY